MGVSQNYEFTIDSFLEPDKRELEMIENTFYDDLDIPLTAYVKEVTLRKDSFKGIVCFKYTCRHCHGENKTYYNIEKEQEHECFHCNKTNYFPEME